MSEVDPNAMDEVSEQEFDADKIKLLPGSSEDGTAATFQIIDEDHTLGNTLRYVIMKNPEVEFDSTSIGEQDEHPYSNIWQYIVGGSFASRFGQLVGTLHGY